MAQRDPNFPDIPVDSALDEELKADRLAVCRDFGLTLAMDLILVLLVGGFQLGRGGVTKACSPELFWAGMIFLYYGGFFCLRSIIVFLSVYWTQKPRVYSLVGRAITWFIDWIALTVLVVHATSTLRSEAAIECKAGDEVIEQWY